MTEAKDFHLKESLASDLKQVNPFIDRVFEELAQRVNAEEKLFRVKLALEEALTNAMRHGNGLHHSRKVTVSISLKDNQIHLDIKDQGNGFNVKSVPDPTKDGYADTMPGGRGIFLMRTLMDEVEFYDNGRGVRMLKKL